MNLKLLKLLRLCLAFAFGGCGVQDRAQPDFGVDLVEGDELSEELVDSAGVQIEEANGEGDSTSDNGTDSSESGSDAAASGTDGGTGGDSGASTSGDTTGSAASGTTNVAGAALAASVNSDEDDLLSLNLSFTPSVPAQSPNCTLVLPDDWTLSTACTCDESSCSADVQPKADFNGAAAINQSLMFTGQVESQATISVNIAPVDDPPRLQAKDPVTFAENSPSMVIDFVDQSGLDEDVDGTVLSYTCTFDQTVPVAASGNCEDITNATWSASAGSLSWPAASADYATYMLTITASDGSLQDQTTLSVTIQNVNQSPVLDSMSNVVMNENSSQLVVDAADGGDDEDVDNETLTYSCYFATPYSGTPVAEVSGNECRTENLAGMTFDSGTGVLNLSADYDAAGTYRIRIVADDGEIEASDFFQLTVNNVNRAPALVAVSSFTVAAETASSINLRNQVTNNDTDEDGDALTYECSVNYGDNTCTHPNLTNAAFNTSTGVLSSWQPPYEQSTRAYILTFRAWDGVVWSSTINATATTNGVPTLVTSEALTTSCETDPQALLLQDTHLHISPPVAQGCHRHLTVNDSTGVVTDPGDSNGTFAFERAHPVDSSYAVTLTGDVLRSVAHSNPMYALSTPSISSATDMSVYGSYVFVAYPSGVVRYQVGVGGYLGTSTSVYATQTKGVAVGALGNHVGLSRAFASPPPAARSEACEFTGTTWNTTCSAWQSISNYTYTDPMHSFLYNSREYFYGEDYSMSFSSIIAYRFPLSDAYFVSWAIGGLDDGSRQFIKSSPDQQWIVIAGEDMVVFLDASTTPEPTFRRAYTFARSDRVSAAFAADSDHLYMSFDHETGTDYVRSFAVPAP